MVEYFCDRTYSLTFSKAKNYLKGPLCSSNTHYQINDTSNRERHGKKPRAPKKSDRPFSWFPEFPLGKKNVRGNPRSSLDFFVVV